MRRVVVTGIGIVSSIGNNKQAVLESLKNGRSGIRYSEEYQAMGFRSQVYGPILGLDLDALIDRKLKRFMGDTTAYGYVAMQEALTDSGLIEAMISNPRTGIIVGSGGESTASVIQAADTLRQKGVKKIGPYGVTKTMSSSTSAVLGTAFKIKGVGYSISSACSTSAHCIGHGAELIQMNKQDIVFAGGCEEVHWSMSSLFDAMGALSSKYNATPQSASRPYDANRDGFVISGGGALVVLEELEHARRRGAKIYAELVGYGATSDGYDMVAPSGEGAVRCMQVALSTIDRPVDYINAHGTSTPTGDTKELEAVRGVFGDKPPPITSTKSLTGHAMGAAGACEAIYSMLMQQNSFIAASANIEQLDPQAEGMPIVRQHLDNVQLDTVMSNSFGFGGANATLIFSKYKD